MALPFALGALLKGLASFIARHLGWLTTTAVATSFLNATAVVSGLAALVWLINSLVAQLNGVFQQIRNSFNNEWAAAASWLAQANSVVPIDFALATAALLLILWGVCAAIGFAFKIANLIR